MGGMSVFSRLLGVRKEEKENRSSQIEDERSQEGGGRCAFVDIEVSVRDGKIRDIGALRDDEAVFHKASKAELLDFLKGTDYLCGHNIVHHDAKYLFANSPCPFYLVDTLYLSPLLFSERPYHRLVKDDKLLSEQLNNPVNDCIKAKELLEDEITRWNELPEIKRRLFASLLWGKQEFEGFLRMVGARKQEGDADSLIREAYSGKICRNADLGNIRKQYPEALAYALALIDTSDHYSITPGWVLHAYPQVEYVISLLRHQPCKQGCEYCSEKLDVRSNLKKFFGFDQFRTYDGEPLQEQAAEAAVKGRSLLAIFPTGGGKSLAFQLPALMAGHTVRGLTVVISPLQSLMKDQVDALSERGITDAVTINGLLDPITRADAIARVQGGSASLLYIAPEMLRSKTLERILFVRNVVRFVIDEAHCFSSWGQDFRVDYLYIGKFIRDYIERKHSAHPIAVSCFTATAKQKVIQDIRDYFKRTLNLDLQLFASSASRTNLRYSVIHVEGEDEKYLKLRELISETTCPTIVYSSRTKRTHDLARRLNRDGYPSLAFNGKMEAEEKVRNQEAFMNDRIRIIVATSAFGMGVDKKDVGLVVHYDISDSLENYVQEAGRAGRDPTLSARCFVLYSDDDLDKHFALLNQTKLSISEINQVWKAVKELTGRSQGVSCSALELARRAGWDEAVADVEMRVRTALGTLEQSGYLERGSNAPHVFADGISVRTVEEARQRIEASRLFDNTEKENAVSIIKSLISKKYTAKNKDAEAESRVDYLADILGLNKREVISAIERMRQEKILADNKDISAYLLESGVTDRKSKNILSRFSLLERYMLTQISNGSIATSYKQLNNSAIENGITTSQEKDVKTLIFFLASRNYLRKQYKADRSIEIVPLVNADMLLKRFERRVQICGIAIEWLYKLVPDPQEDEKVERIVQFSVIELLNHINAAGKTLFSEANDIGLEEVEDALLYLSKIGALKLDGGFLVLYNAMNIRKIKDNKTRYKQEDYRMLNEFYKQKIQQVHIVGEYANLMVRDYNAALTYVQDYFSLDYKKFIAKYFKAERINEIQLNITPGKYKKLFASLSQKQMSIISNKASRAIVVAAGPGSGKTRVLVHKLASLLLMEDVKHEQLLMLTFSRAAATEFKERLMELIGTSAHYVEIKTFHSYCFDLLGRVGTLEDAKGVVKQAADMIKCSEVEPNKISKAVLVIDEAQDMGEEEYLLVEALMEKNEEMRVIAVGDDDQNIYEFRGSNSKYMLLLSRREGGCTIEMTENYRSAKNIVDFANAFARGISVRLKSKPIISKREETGMVGVTHHKAKYMYAPLVKELISSKQKGSIGVLTQTNEEAVILVGLLCKRGVDCKLIQSTDGFAFGNLVEMRYFLKYINSRITTSIISDELWQEAKERTTLKYEKSESLRYVIRCADLFEKTNRKKYLSDFKEFVYESSVEDFCEFSHSDVVVSTIHKAKGREFDNVYMLLCETYGVDDQVLRRYYVGMTRARNRLGIHTNLELFKSLSVGTYLEDETMYPMPGQVVLQLTFKDVNLGFFKHCKREVLSLCAGDEVRYCDNYLYKIQTNEAVAQLSIKMQGTLSKWQERGYAVNKAIVRFIVAWKPKDAPLEEEESAVLLADLTLVR